MTKGAALAGDAARLWQVQELHILDSDPEIAFDDLAKVASILCDAPVALFSLVDAHRQWFKARVGVDLSETPIEQAICVHALGSDEIVEIPDLSTDPRTRENPLVTGEPDIRFYAGAPLNTKDGHTVGTLCVIDMEARPQGLTPQQREGLAALGRQAMNLLEIRKALTEGELSALRDRRRTQVTTARADRHERERKISDDHIERQIAAQQAGRIGTFEIDSGSDVVRVSPEFCRLFGLEEAETYPAKIMIDSIHPDDRHLSSTQQGRDGADAVRDVEYRVIRPSDGTTRWISRRASFDFGADGKPIRMLGTVHDVTERRFSHDRMRFLLELGDRLHVAETSEDAALAAGDSLRQAFGVDRAGYSSFDLAAGRVYVQQDSAAADVQSVKGWRPTSDYPETMEKMREGHPVAIFDIRELDWMKQETESYLAVGAIAQLWIPVFVHNVLVGALFAQSRNPRHWTHEEIEFAQSVGHRTYMAVAKLQAQSDQQLLNEELGHRMKNMLAMIMALATQSLKAVGDRDAVNNFRKRLIALGTAHEDLLRRNWSAGSIRTILQGTLNKLGHAGQIEIDGPDIMVGPRAALSLSLIAHELTTNAIKYGALSNETGGVTIDWSIKGAGEHEKLTLRWREQGGPAVTVPDHSGFGAQLIRLGLLGSGDANLDYRPDGLVAEFTASMPLARTS